VNISEISDTHHEANRLAHRLAKVVLQREEAHQTFLMNKGKPDLRALDKAYVLALSEYRRVVSEVDGGSMGEGK
jgi:hypothetical protein